MIRSSFLITRWWFTYAYGPVHGEEFVVWFSRVSHGGPYLADDDTIEDGTTIYADVYRKEVADQIEKEDAAVVADVQKVVAKESANKASK